MGKNPAKPSEALKAAILDAGLSQNALARMSGVDVAAVSRFLSGKVGLTLNSLDQLAPVLGLALVRTKPATPGHGGGAQSAGKGTGGGQGASGRRPRQRGGKRQQQKGHTP
jgi:transcriptional regulator with XRE-family HTH domain